MLKWYIFAIIVMLGGVALAQESPVLINSQEQSEPEVPIEKSNDLPVTRPDDGKAGEETDTEDLNGAELRWGWGGRGYGGWGGWGRGYGGWGGRGYGGGLGWGGGWGGLGYYGGWGGYGGGWGGYRRYWG